MMFAKESKIVSGGKISTDGFIQRMEVGKNRIQSFAFVIAVLICGLFAAGYAGSSLIGLKQLCGIELDEQINPNEASAASLARLPNIGTERAKAIISYRESFSKENGSCLAFQKADDLQKVNGIGTKTAQNISKWLKFE